MSRLDIFMQTAMSHIGEHGDWVWANAPQERGHAWCAAFVWTCSKFAGVNNTLIPYTYSARYMGKMTHEQLHGQLYISPAYGGSASFSPRRGDLIFFRWTHDRSQPWWVANHVGIVTSTTGDTVNTVEGNTGGQGNWGNIVKERHCAKTWNKIAYYVRPAWTNEDYDDAPPSDDTTPWLDAPPITDNPAWDQIAPNTRNDMMIREVGYVTADQLSTQPSSISLSVVNYTSGISSLIRATGIIPNYFASGDYSVDRLKPVPRAIAQQLVTYGFTMSAAIGILGNMERESDFHPEEVNPHGGASGLCQWFGERCVAMRQFVGPDWAHNVTGQVNFLIYEVTEVAFFRNKLLNFLKTCPNSIEGVRTAADTFFHWYESLGTYTESESLKRIRFAEAMWNQLEPIEAPTVSTKLDQFISYLNEQVVNHSIYVWGAQGKPGSEITREWIRSRESDDNYYQQAVTFWQRQVDAGYGQVLRAFDCSGLGMYWLQDVSGILTWDHSASNLYEECAPITKSQLRRGDFVFRRNDTNKIVHVGYIVDDNRTVIEAKGRSYGVIKHEFLDSSWNVYGRPPFWTE